MLTLHTNVAQMSSLNSQRTTGGKLNAIMRDLSTGKKNDLYKNDPAAARISAMLNMHASGTKSAIGNMKYAQASTRVAQGALDKANELLVTMKDLATQAADGLKGDAEKAALQQQYTNNSQALKAIFDNTTFAGKNLLKMEFGARATGLLASGSIDLQVGAGAGETKKLDISTELGGLFSTIGGVTAQFGTVAGRPFAVGDTLASKMGFDGAGAGNDAARALVNELRTKPGMAAILSTTHSSGETWEAKLTADLETIAETSTYATAGAVATAFEAAMNNLTNSNTTLTSVQQAQVRVAMDDLLRAKAEPAATQLVDGSAASNAIGGLETAIAQLATVQASIGAMMMDLDGREEVQSVLLQNTSEANARMKEVDFAESVSELTKLQTQMNVNLQMLQKAGEMPGMIQMLLR
ncbi:flagellin [Pandoraea bronchicola]|uniref:Flagellin n=1 Tax=Pandoraea bronchicola TaxID=2508287 RepID=A0A5E5BT59_9BURK|nr:flagellin [Pandoraea bronchicola]VVE88265.1 lateral flagellin LafA [Pandoraea bronchicola]